MHTYLYQWHLEAREGFRVNVEVAAGSAVHARRAVEAFLEDHGATSWTLGSVSRGARVAERAPVAEPAVLEQVLRNLVPVDLCPHVVGARGAGSAGPR